jgi:hypothetical protein
MTTLADISTFPPLLRDRLSRHFGLRTAEAFYEHVLRNPAGVAKGLEISSSELDTLRQLVEPHLTPQFIRQCRKAPPKRPRGVIVD